MIEALSSAFSQLLEWINQSMQFWQAFFDYIESLASAAIGAVWDFILGGVAWLFWQLLLQVQSMILEVAVSLLQSIGVFSTVLSGWSALPEDIRQILTAIKLPEAVGMLFHALISRLSLQYMLK